MVSRLPIPIPHVAHRVNPMRRRMALLPLAAGLAAAMPGTAAAQALPAAQPAATPPARAPYALPRTESRIVLSRAGDPYQIMISWPDGDVPPGGFPVVYALDGNAVFGTLTETVRRITRPYGPGQALSAPVIVAIGYPDTDNVHRTRRTLDYTPPAPRRPQTADALRTNLPQGGADIFLDFLQDTLRPLVARDYPIDPDRQILMGHSFGGLFVLHALFTRPTAFQSYVAISPSIWWNGEYLLREAEAFLHTRPPVQAQVLISLGSLEQGGRSADPVSGVSRAQLLAQQLQDAQVPGLRVSFRIHDGETHGSVVPIALARALPQVLAP